MSASEDCLGIFPGIVHGMFVGYAEHVRHLIRRRTTDYATLLKSCKEPRGNPCVDVWLRLCLGLCSSLLEDVGYQLVPVNDLLG